MPEPPTNDTRRLRLTQVALVLALLGLFVWRLTVNETENVNWDEFAFFFSAQGIVKSGVLYSARPGLAFFPVLPLVRECSDAIDAIVGARLLWTGFVIAYLAGIFLILRRLRDDPALPRHLCALGVALLALVPVFMRWSIQVRTDTPALALGIWAGVALIASRRHVAWAALAGALYALGFLCSQKLLYLGGLTAVLACGNLLFAREFRVGRELLRAALVCAAGLVVIVAYRAVVEYFFFKPPPSLGPIGHQLDYFAFLRRVLGFRAYRGMLGTLIPHGALCLMLVAATAGLLWRRRVTAWRELLVAWALLGMGLFVARFHAAAFPYFFMTLGAFVAVAGAIAVEPITQLFGHRWATRLVLGAIWLLIAARAIPAGYSLLRDTQAPQRETFALVERNFAAKAVGFHPEGALFCRDTPQLGIFFSHNIAARFHHDQDDQQAKKLLGRFRKLPVEFMIASYRLNQFPLMLKRFWSTRYVQYRAALFVPGASVRGEPGTIWKVELLSPGRYAWLVPPGHPPARIQIGGQVLRPGETIEVEAGTHRLQILDALKAGTLLRTLKDPPGPLGPFYSIPARMQFEGVPTFW
jgi:hypothetical protein